MKIATISFKYTCIPKFLIITFVLISYGGFIYRKTYIMKYLLSKNNYMQNKLHFEATLAQTNAKT